ncbi:MAG: alpha-glucosidase/alpha-galactosidase, partial [Clostridia bacterium]|nr:alpha-glucosidase/alpha-galactosidase [Clostridia bacterium]
MKVTFVGAGSSIFAKNVLGDTMMCPTFYDMEIALYDIDADRLEESRVLIEKLNENINQSRATVKTYLGVGERKAALKAADFVVNAVQIGGYDPCTVMDFEIPKKYGLRQTIGDTLGIGGIFRGLRTIQFLKGLAADMEEVCPNAWLLNYTNPMA